MAFENSDSSAEDKVQMLSAVLNDYSMQLETMPGVTGWGVGLSESDDLGRVVIKVYVDTPAVLETVTEQAGKAFGQYPFEVVYLPTLDAQ